MDHARYVGKNPALLGRTALLRPKEGSTGEVLAQFDFPPERLDADKAPDAPDELPECFGWTEYPATDFVLTDGVHEVCALESELP